jgi:hypothetical protein
MTVYRDDQYLGMMKVSGLSGEYCWVVALEGKGDVARIETNLTPPASIGAPTLPAVKPAPHFAIGCFRQLSARLPLFSHSHHASLVLLLTITTRM